MKVILKQCKKDCKAIWKYLSTHKNPYDDSTTNKRWAMIKLGISINYLNSCPLCHWVDGIKSNSCTQCPIQKKYNDYCGEMGYKKYEDNPTQANAKKFYDNIKGCLV